MRDWRGMGAAVLAVWLVAGCGGGSDDRTEPGGKAKTTLMVYMLGSDLEAENGFASANLAEMFAAEQSADVRVVITTGGADKEGGSGPVTSWKRVKRHVLDGQRLREIDDVGAVSMGRAETLTDFIDWAQAHYPAERYMLAFWNHGAGHRGFGGDQNHEPALLSVADIGTALAKAQARSGIHFDFIGFDACLMAGAEVASVLAPYGHVLGASQELEPGSGWDWRAIVSSLARDPSLPATRFAAGLADAYFAKQTAQGTAYRDQGQLYLDDAYTTFSITDLKQMPAVVAALDGWATAVGAQLNSTEQWTRVSRARSRSDAYGGEASDGGQNRAIDAVDLVHLAQNIAREGLAQPEAAVLAQAVSSAVIHRVGGERTRHANGLSIYFPSRAITEEALANYGEQRVPASYRALLERFVHQVRHVPSEIGISLDVVAEDILTANVKSTYGIEAAYVVLEGVAQQAGQMVMLGTMPALSVSDYGEVTHPLAGQWVTLNGHPVVMAQVAQENDAENRRIARRFMVPVLLNDEPTQLGLRLDEEGAWSFDGRWEGVDDNGVPQRSGQPLRPDDVITPLVLTYDLAADDIVAVERGTSFKAGTPTVGATDLAAGSYRVRLMLEDYAEGTGFSESVTLPVR